MKEQLSQLVQDVIDGNESAIKARKMLIEHQHHVSKCLMKLYPYYTNERDGNDKNINQH